jgi:hypothetical protein
MSWHIVGRVYCYCKIRGSTTVQFSTRVQTVLPSPPCTVQFSTCVQTVLTSPPCTVQFSTCVQTVLPSPPCTVQFSTCVQTVLPSPPCTVQFSTCVQTVLPSPPCDFLLFLRKKKYCCFKSRVWNFTEKRQIKKQLPRRPTYFIPSFVTD